MKTWSIMLAVVVLMILVSSFAWRPFGSERGDDAPNFRLENDETTYTLSDMEGKHVLLNFWSAHHPESRIDNAKYSDLSKKFPKDKFAYIGVNMDSDTTLARQILRADGIDNDAQFFSAEKGNKAIVNAYNISNAHRSFLIDPTGHISAVAPDEAHIMATL